MSHPPNTIWGVTQHLSVLPPDPEEGDREDKPPEQASSSPRRDFVFNALKEVIALTHPKAYTVIISCGTVVHQQPLAQNIIPLALAVSRGPSTLPLRQSLHKASATYQPPSGVSRREIRVSDACHDRRKMDIQKTHVP